ncbi:MAG: GNAT family N-acetyltransferase [Candidatus Marsarchaeota archaeon]|nr:GNAT family N-acetyltransferase [Candidatus Marsarchaeota archaeon]
MVNTSVPTAREVHDLKTLIRPESGSYASAQTGPGAELKIRKAKREDLSRFVKLARGIWGIAESDGEIGVFSKGLWGQYHRQINIVAVSGNELVGYASIRPLSKETLDWHSNKFGMGSKKGTMGYLTIGVSGGHRRSGIGQYMMEEVIRKARSAGHIAVFLEVEKHNGAATALYEKLGFKYVDSIGCGYDCLRMMLDLRLSR